MARSKTLECVYDIPIVLIDHDTASVASLTSILQQFSKNVMSVDVASKALSLIEGQKDIGVVIANVEMLHIDSHSFITTLLQKHIPLMLINPEIKTQKTSDLLTKEACFYLNKPISENDIKNMWQHVLLKKSQEDQDLKKPNITKLQDNVMEKDNNQIESFKRQRTTQANDNQDCLIDIKNKSKESKKIKNNVRRHCSLWTDERHMNFLSAISILGPKETFPKSILKLMNDPNLNYHQVASHLQKYRAKVKQISDTLPRKNLIECSNPLLDSLTQKNSSSSSSFKKPVLEENLDLSNHSLVDANYVPWSPSYVLPETQKSLVPCERSNAALVNLVPQEPNIEEKNYDPLEDIISFDIEADQMDMFSWSEDYLGHDFACNNLMGSIPQEDHDDSMKLRSTRQQHNMMESCQYQNIEATNQREGFNFDDYRDCIDWIEEMMNKDENYRNCIDWIEEMMNKDETD